MFRKRMILAGVVAAVAVAAVPAVAMGQWTHQTTSITQEKNITLTGTFSTSSAIGGFGCSTGDMGVTLTPGTTGTVNTFESGGTCNYNGGLAGCVVTTVQGTKLPWTVHSNTSTIDIKGVEIFTTVHGAFCPYHDLRVKGTLRATPDNLHAMTEVSLSATATASGPPHVPGGLEFYNGTTGAPLASIVIGDTHTISPSGTFGMT